MKNDHPVITLLGSNSGNNLGDAAIMSAVLDSIASELPAAEFLIPSSRPAFVDRHYGKKYRVRGISFMPWTLSVRMVGLTTFRALARSDCALICDGIIFGKKLFNPFFNFLIALVFVVPFARLVGCKMVCYCCGIGPFRSAISRHMARWVLNGCDLVIMREQDSKKLAEEIGVTTPVHIYADAAFINPVNSAERAREILAALKIPKDKPLFGINVTKYMDAWLADSERLQDRGAFLKMLAAAVQAANSQLNGAFRPIVFSTHPMDEPVAQELANLLSTAVIENRTLLSHDIQAVMRECELFIGMRFHSVILASAVGTPIVGLIYAPKVRGFMRQLGCEDFSLELGDLTVENLSERIVAAWNSRGELRKRQQSVIEGLRIAAKNAAKLIKDRYFSSQI